jgi:hypothetical protein
MKQNYLSMVIKFIQDLMDIFYIIYNLMEILLFKKLNKFHKLI